MGASPQNVRKDWIVGISGLQGFLGVQRESVPVDLQLIAHFQSRKIVTDPVACNSGDGYAACATNNHHAWQPVGWGVMLSFDGVTLLTQLISALPLK